MQRAYFNILGMNLDVSLSGSNSLLELLRHAFGFYEVVAPTDAATKLGLTETDQGWRVRVDEREDTFAFDDEWPRLDDLVKLLVVRFHHGKRLFVHSSSVERDGAVSVFVGATTSGKTTIAAALGARGWKIVSDDLTPIEPESAATVPFRTAPNIRAFTKDILLGDVSSVLFDPANMDTKQLRVSHIYFLNQESPDTVRRGYICRDMRKSLGVWSRMRTICELGDFVDPPCGSTSLVVRNPEYFDREPVLEPISSAHASRCFMKHLCVPNERVRDLLPRVTGFIGRTSCFSLHLGELESTLALLEKDQQMVK